MTETVKLTCTVDGLEANSIELRPRWTRADTKRLDGIEDEAYIEFLREKIVKCHIEVYGADGGVVETIKSPDDLTDEVFDELDEVLIGWLGGALYTFIGQRRSLGNLSARVSSSTNGKVPAPTQTTDQNQPTTS